MNNKDFRFVKAGISACKFIATLMTAIVTSYH